MSVVVLCPPPPSRTLPAAHVAVAGTSVPADAAVTDVTGVPVTIISSGIDLADPDDFRSLQWKVPPGDVVTDVKNSGDQAALHGPVTFVLVPTILASAFIAAIWPAESAVRGSLMEALEYE